MQPIVDIEHHNSVKKESHSTWLHEIRLTQFRNYAALALEADAQPVILTGKNGAGKTNLLEAISFLAPGRGLRSTRLDQPDHRDAADASHAWAISATLETYAGQRHIGTGRDPSATGIGKRLIKIDHMPVQGQGALAEILTVMWQTPQMDGLFLGASSDRRRFIDRMAYHFHPDHARSVQAYEKAMRERLRLLYTGGNPRWLDALEKSMAEAAVAVAAARYETIVLLRRALEHAPQAFPKPEVALNGAVEQMLGNSASALDIEEEILRTLHQNRAQDGRLGKTHYGVHRTDISVIHREKNMPAAECSTGEQKALLLSLVLAEARAKVFWKKEKPILLLDEVVAHLDAGRRESLFAEILSMGVQVWMTGTDAALFEGMEGKAQFLGVEGNAVE